MFGSSVFCGLGKFLVLAGKSTLLDNCSVHFYDELDMFMQVVVLYN